MASARAVMAIALRSLGAMVLIGASLGAVAQEALDLRVDEPRAFGWFVGDRIVRRVHVDVPDGWVLDESSLPGSGRGGALELRRVARTSDDARHLTLDFEYQVFIAPAEPRKIDLPTIALRFDATGSSSGTPVAPRELRAQQWPIVVTPLVMPAAPSARGFGELRPDALAPPLPTRRYAVALALCLGLAVALLAFLALRPAWRRWWQRRHQPFAAGWRGVRLALRANDPAAAEEGAYRALHAAFDACAGRVLLAADAAALARGTPHLAPLAARIEAFYAASRQRFFGAPGAALNGAQLLELARDLRDAEHAADASVPMPARVASAGAAR